jgi:hypothetical protein
MTPKEAIDQHLKRRLDDTFGAAVATMIIASASNAAGASVFDPGVEDFVKLATAVCCDQRVLDMWGHAGAQDALDQFKGMVASGQVS